MKKLIATLLATTLILAAALTGCTASLPQWFGSVTALAAADTDGVNVTSHNIMAVFYTIHDDHVLFYFTAPTIVDNLDGTWTAKGLEGTATGIDQDLVDYGLYHAQVLTITEGITLDSLGLTPITWEDLPRSQHIAKLVAVDTQALKPVTVRRKYLGTTYDIQCLVSHSAVTLWQQGQLQVGDYVIVSFIDEIPDTNHRILPIVVDKVYQTW